MDVYGPPELDGLIALRSCRWMHRHSVKRQVRYRDRVCQAAGVLPGICSPVAHRLTVHHRLPREHGGSDRIENLTLVCLPHHKALHRSGEASVIARAVGLLFLDAEPVVSFSAK